APPQPDPVERRVAEQYPWWRWHERTGKARARVSISVRWGKGVVRERHPRDHHLGDRTALHVDDLDAPALYFHHVPGLIRDVTETVEDQAGDRGVVAVRRVHADVGEVVHGETPREQHRAVGQLTDREDVAVGFVVDLADELFDEVLDRH